MIGLGTIINVAAIVAGGSVGTLFGSRLPARFQDTLCVAAAMSTIFLGISGAVEGMVSVDGGALSAGHALLVVVSLMVGGLVGELLDLHSGIIRFGRWLKVRSGSEEDAGFIGAFVTASVTVCVGAMAIVGAIQDGISGDYSVLAVKSVLDFAIVLAMASALGRGAIFSAIPVGLFQGFFTVCAVFIKPLMTQAALANLSMVGSILIACVGVNLLWPDRIKVANLLPAIVVAPALAFTPWGL